MGNFKNKLRDGVQKLREHGKETTDAGAEMQDDAAKVNEVIKGIEVQDDQDSQAIREAQESYQVDFDETFEKEVEEAANEIEDEQVELSSEIQDEILNVEEGINKLSEAGSITDIGSENAASAGEALENSRTEYEETDESGQESIDELKDLVSDLKGGISGIFG